MICDRSVKFSRVNCLPSTEALPEWALLCKYSKLCVLSPLLFIILSKYFNLHTEAPQAAFRFAYGRYPATFHFSFFPTSQHLIACASPFHNKNRIAIKMQFDCGGGEDHECSDRWGIISIIFYNKFCSSGSRVVTLANKMIQSSYWNFSVQLILDDLHAFNSIW